ncbi:hypothetical protein M3664_04935 [Paenibacillus lautus]|uniref:hypothetical protein n=1 Tax=Paenibacillus lautus TaxID=1401 RepID=UPI002041155D|nr:hypothetical protein [Paenibacillus lautus]MCM3257128.1 hypothetical protein [Paenibacillus lautus]
MSRDWQKDMELIKIGETSDIPYCISEFKNMLPYYHQQYAAEKARADKAERREQKLKWGYEIILSYVPIRTRKELGFEGFLPSLYPKEETKP